MNPTPQPLMLALIREMARAKSAHTAVALEVSPELWQEYSKELSGSPSNPPLYEGVPVVENPHMYGFRFIPMAPCSECGEVGHDLTYHGWFQLHDGRWARRIRDTEGPS